MRGVRTKLHHYLTARHESHRAFAERAGIGYLHPMVSQWASAKVFPGLAPALAIEKATGGEVPASYWVELRNRLKKAGKLPGRGKR